MSLKKTPHFELRSGSIDTFLFIVKTPDLDILRAELCRRFEVTPEFFTNDVVAIDLRRLKEDQRVSLTALAELLTSVRMCPIGVIARDAQHAWAGDGGLPLVEPFERRMPKSHLDLQASRPFNLPDQQLRPDPSPNVPAHDAVRAGTAHPVKLGLPTAASADTAEIDDEIAWPTLVIDRPLRSGQQIYAKGNLVVLGLVSYGAEVIAEGNVHIYAPLRGRVLAGVQGNQSARIFCTCLEPELISIAGVYRTTDTPLPLDVQSKPVQVRLVNEKLLIEPLRLT